LSLANRTTFSLDDDVATLLNEEMQRSGISFKQAVNHYLRLGLAAAKQPVRKEFVVKPRAMGLPPGLSYDNIGELLEAIEGPLHR
jgi:hypothetical protein